jgi:hypothetical protein
MWGAWAGMTVFTKGFRGFYRCLQAKARKVPSFGSISRTVARGTVYISGFNLQIRINCKKVKLLVLPDILVIFMRWFRASDVNIGSMCHFWFQPA